MARLTTAAGIAKQFAHHAEAARQLRRQFVSASCAGWIHRKLRSAHQDLLRPSLHDPGSGLRSRLVHRLQQLQQGTEHWCRFCQAVFGSWRPSHRPRPRCRGDQRSARAEVCWCCPLWAPSRAILEHISITSTSST